jgi:hypothetical protein
LDFWSVLRTSIAIGVPRLTPSKIPESTSTRSASWRWVVIALWPGRRRSSSSWIASSDTATPGGMPSTTTPTAAPCDSPNVVTRKSRPNVELTRASSSGRPPRRAGTGQLLLRRLDRALAIGLVIARRASSNWKRVRDPDVGARVGDQAGDLVPGHDVLAGVIEEQLACSTPRFHERATISQ